MKTMHSAKQFGLPQEDRMHIPLISDCVPSPRPPRAFNLRIVIIKLLVLLFLFLIGLYNFSQPKYSDLITLKSKVMYSDIDGLVAFNGSVACLQNEQNHQERWLAKQLTQLRTEVEQALDDRIQSALNTYDADKVAMIDYALEANGGHIISTPGTIAHTTKLGINLFGLLSFQTYRSPRVILQTGTIPGECYAFRGHEGRFRIKLAVPIQITAVTIEHAAFSTVVDIRSAPRKFSVYAGLEEKSNIYEKLGTFTYNVYIGKPLQTFYMDMDSVFSFWKKRLHEGSYCLARHQIVELKIESNHGHPDYTCLYRVRVHGNH